MAAGMNPHKPRRPWVAFVAELLVPGGGWLYLHRTVICLAAIAATLLGLAGVIWAAIHAPGMFWPVFALVAVSRVADSVLALMTAQRHTVAAGSNISMVVGLALAECAFAFIITQNVLAAYVLCGTSMEPLLLPGDELFVQKLDPDDPLDVDEVVSFLGPDDTVMVDRVVAGPGQHVVVHGNQVIVGGTDVMADKDDRGPYTLMPDTYFLAGDNREGAKDSRQFGPVPRDRIQGRVVSVGWSHTKDGFRFDRFGIPIH
jgi:signal peptidase I